MPQRAPCRTARPKEGSVLATAMAERHRRQVPLLPLGWQATAKRKKLRDSSTAPGSPCQVVSGHVQLNTLHNCQLEKGTRCSEPAFCHLFSRAGAGPGTRWERQTGRLRRPTLPWQLKSNPAINTCMLLSRGGLHRKLPFLLLPGFPPHAKQL